MSRERSFTIKNRGIEQSTVIRNSGKRMLLNTGAKEKRPKDMRILSTVKSEPIRAVGISVTVHVRRFGISFLDSSEQTSAAAKKASGESEIPEPPSASHKKPAAMPQTAEERCVSNRATAATPHSVILGTAGIKVSPVKKEH